MVARELFALIGRKTGNNLLHKSDLAYSISPTRMRQIAQLNRTIGGFRRRDETQICLNSQGFGVAYHLTGKMLRKMPFSYPGLSCNGSVIPDFKIFCKN